MVLKQTKIKPHGTFKISPGGGANIPSLIRKEIDKEEISFVVDAKTAILFAHGTSLEDILKSIEVLKDDLVLRTIKRGRSK